MSAVTAASVTQYFRTSHSEGLFRVAYSPNNRFFASTARDFSVVIYNASTFEEVAVLQRNPFPLGSARFESTTRLEREELEDAQERQRGGNGGRRASTSSGKGDENENNNNNHHNQNDNNNALFATTNNIFTPDWLPLDFNCKSNLLLRGGNKHEIEIWKIVPKDEDDGVDDDEENNNNNNEQDEHEKNKKKKKKKKSPADFYSVANSSIHAEDFVFVRRCFKLHSSRLLGHTGRIPAAKFSPTNPNELASCSTDQTIRIFRVLDQQEEEEEEKAEREYQNALLAAEEGGGGEETAGVVQEEQSGKELVSRESTASPEEIGGGQEGEGTKSSQMITSASPTQSGSSNFLGLSATTSSSTGAAKTAKRTSISTSTRPTTIISIMDTSSSSSSSVSAVPDTFNSSTTTSSSSPPSSNTNLHSNMRSPNGSTNVHPLSGGVGSSSTMTVSESHVFIRTTTRTVFNEDDDESYENNNSVWPKKRRDEKKALRIIINVGEWVEDLTWSPCGKKLVSCDMNHLVTVWNASDGSKIETLLSAVSAMTRQTSPLTPMMQQQDSSYSSSTLTSGVFNGGAGAGGDTKSNLLETASHLEAPTCAIFSRDGKTIYSAGRDRQVRCWRDLSSSSSSSSSSSVPSPVSTTSSAAVSPSASASSSQKQKVVDQTYHCEYIADTGSEVLSLVLTNDELILVCGCKNGSVRLLAAATGKLIGSPLLPSSLRSSLSDSSLLQKTPPKMISRKVKQVQQQQSKKEKRQQQQRQHEEEEEYYGDEEEKDGDGEIFSVSLCPQVQFGGDTFAAADDSNGTICVWKLNVEAKFMNDKPVLVIVAKTFGNSSSQNNKSGGGQEKKKNSTRIHILTDVLWCDEMSLYQQQKQQPQKNSATTLPAPPSSSAFPVRLVSNNSSSSKKRKGHNDDTSSDEESNNGDGDDDENKKKDKHMITFECDLPVKQVQVAANGVAIQAELDEPEADRKISPLPDFGFIKHFKVFFLQNAPDTFIRVTSGRCCAAVTTTATSSSAAASAGNNNSSNNSSNSIIRCPKCKAGYPNTSIPQDWKCLKCSALIWNPDSACCEICGAGFSFFVRHHHARCCGRCCCSNCVFSPPRVFLMYGESREQNVSTKENNKEKICFDCIGKGKKKYH